jgi:integrase
MGLYKLCQHKRRERDRCEHAWWGSFRGVRVSLSRWANRDVRSKTEASVVLDAVRAAIRTRTFDRHGAEPVDTRGPMTFREFAAIYKERHVIAKGLSRAQDFDWMVRPFMERFGHRSIGEIKTADVEDLMADLRKPRQLRLGAEPQAPMAATVNRQMDVLRHMMNWAVGREYIEQSPFKRGSETLIKKLREDNQRRRRISPDEEAALIDAAPPHLEAMLIVAIDTGMRQGEMLAMRFGDIDFKRGLITLRAATTKSKRSRVIPMSTDRLRDVLQWLRVDADEEWKSDEALVFSNEVGEPLCFVHSTWMRTVLKAHGIAITWGAGVDYKGPSKESQAAFRKINLRWHDLRHEYASRLVEEGVPLAQVGDLLGHASITTTERYDNQRLETLQLAVTKLERGGRFSGAVAASAQGSGLKAQGGLATDDRWELDAPDDPSPLPSSRPTSPRLRRASKRGERAVTKSFEAGDPHRKSARVTRKLPAVGQTKAEPERAHKASRKFQDPTQQLATETPKSASDTEANELIDLNLGDWLGGRDSNPDNRVQSAVSYR